MTNLSVVIPFRNEDMLAYTINRIRETATGSPEIITVDDGSDKKVTYPTPDKAITLSAPVGNCYARHLGICDATHDAVLVIDAHMNFLPGWDRRVLDWFYVGGNTRISCFRCPQLSREDMGMDGKNEYHGARLKWTDISFGRRRLLPNKWYNYHAPCQVGCLLGGAYLLSSAWYHGIGAPWQYMRGWGHSEQIISIVNYMMGGENWIADEPIGHMFRTGKFHEVPYQSFVYQLYYNQHVVAEVCVDDALDKRELLAHIEKDEIPIIRRKVAAQLQVAGVDTLRQYIVRNRKRDWQQYKQAWITPYEETDK